MPKVSVIICTYNRANLLPTAIESVLVQSFQNFEIIIIDSASTDNTEEIMKPYEKNKKIRYYRSNTDSGISSSRNKGVSLSAGIYIAMLDSDDYWTDKEKLNKQVEILDKNKEIGIVGSSMILVKKDGSKIKDVFCEMDDFHIRKNMLIENQFNQSAVLFRKKAFEEAGGYDENLEVAEDYDLWLQVGKKYRFANLKESTIAYMIHSEGISKIKKKLMAKTVDKLIEKYKNDYSGYWKAKIISWVRILKALF